MSEPDPEGPNPWNYDQVFLNGGGGLSFDANQENIEGLEERAKQIESALDTKLLKLGRLCHALRTNPLPQLPMAQSLEGEIGTLLNELTEILQEMGKRREELLGPTAISAPLGSLQRHREIEKEYRREGKKFHQIIQNARSHAQLLPTRSVSGVQGGGPLGGNTASATTYLLQEGQRIVSAQAQTETIIEMASLAQGRVQEQRSTLVQTQGKMAELADRFPIINQILIKVQVRRVRDRIILGGVIGSLLALFMFLLFRR